ncbi:MAG: hypothetical protein WA952_15735 [Lewinella sp.]
MNKLFLFLCLIGTLSLNAQIARGDKLVSLSSYFPAAQADVALSHPQTAYNAGIQYDGVSESTVAFYGGEYGYALRDRLLLGIGVLGIHEFSDGGSSTFLLEPRLRYYALNTPELMVFGQVGSAILRSEEIRQYFEAMQLTAGVHYPLSETVLLTPELSYDIREGRNSVMLELGLDVKIIKEEGEDVQSGIRRGRVMLGAQSARLAFRDGATGAGLEVGGHYFLSDRFAVGGQVGYSGDYAQIATGGGNTSNLNFVQWNAAAATRYYLSTNGRMAWFAQAGLGLRRTSFVSDILVDIDAQTNGFFFFGGGLQLFTSEQFSFEGGPALQYNLALGSWKYGLNFGVRWVL